MSTNLAHEYEEYSRAGKQAKAIRSKAMYFKSPNMHKTDYYDGVPTPVVFKIIKNIDKATGKTNRNVGYSTMKALDYLAHDVELSEEETLENVEQIELDKPNFLDNNLTLECDDGRLLKSKEERLELYNEWKYTFTNRKNGKDFEHILLSTKELPGTHDKEILDAARQTLSKQFADKGYNYVFVLHRDREHTHVHAIVRVHNTINDNRLDIKKDDIGNVKDTFASELRSRGLNYENYINFNRILGINSQLEYLQKNDLSWFQSNMRKFENEDIKELLKTIKDIDKNLLNLIKQKENKKLSREDKKVLSDKISLQYADKRAIIHKLNGLEYDLQQATKNYTSLIKKRDSIEWYLKQTKAYKEIDHKTVEAEQLVIQKKLELNAALEYIANTKGNLTFSSKLKKDTLYFIKEHIKDNENINIESLFYQLSIIETKMPKSKLAKEIKALKNEFEKFSNLVDIQTNEIKNIETVSTATNKLSKPIMQKLSDTEVTQLKDETLDELRISDPLPVLESLGLEIKLASGNYQFRVRAEDKTSSAYMYLKAGEWKFNDFGGDSGSIENVVMEVLGRDYKDALDYSLDILNIRNRLTDKLKDNQNISQIQNTQLLRENEIKKIKALKSANITRESNTSSNSKIISTRKINASDKDVIKFLENRGIKKLPKDFFVIEGEINGIGKNGPYTIKNKGIGVMTGDMSKDIDIKTQGADIHLLNPAKRKDGSILKTVSYGSKDFTLIPGKNKNALAVFESKMDYAAAIQQINLDDRNVIIANGVGNYKKIADWINKNKIENTTFFNQYDKAGNKFVDDIVEATTIKEFQYIKYDKNEFKNDINDLLLDKIDLKSRLNRGDLNNFLVDMGEEPKELKKEPISNSKTVLEAKKTNQIEHNKSKEQYEYKKNEFINKVISAIDKSIDAQRAHNYEDVMLKASKSISSDLKRNINQIEDTKRILEEIPKSYGVEKKALKENINNFFKKTRKTNDILKQYIEKIDNSDFNNQTKVELKLSLYNELAKHRYSERVTSLIPSIKDEMINRSLEHFKLINQKLSNPKLHKEDKVALTNNSSQLLKDFNKLSPTWNQERAITKLHKEQVKGLNKLHKGIQI